MLVDFVGGVSGLSKNEEVGVATRAGLGNSKQELNKSRDDPMIFLPSLNLGKVAFLWTW